MEIAIVQGKEDEAMVHLYTQEISLYTTKHRRTTSGTKC
jgi:hypothetical protein